MIADTVRGARLVAGQEFRIRLRTGRWRWLLGAWIVVLFVVTLLTDVALHTSEIDGPVGIPLFGVLMLFVLALVLVISPALTAQSVNGDRERGTLATLQITRLSAFQIALGKLAAGWAVGLVALALTLPFTAWSMVEGGLTIARVAAVYGVDALLMGAVCAVSQALSALLARSITSALLSYLVVFTLSLGTVFAFFLATPLTMTRTTVHEDPDSGFNDTPDTENVAHTEWIWWLLAPNPFVVLADSAPALPPRVYRHGDGDIEVRADDPFSEIRFAVRQARLSPQERQGYYSAVETEDGRTPRHRAPDRPVWPYGLGFDVLLGAGAVLVTTRRLRAPSRRLARGVRVG